MAKPEPSMDEWLKEAKQDPKAAQVREGRRGARRRCAGRLQLRRRRPCKEALTWPGVYYVRMWLNEGVLNVGDSLMYVLIDADIRPRCIDALQQLVGKIKNELVVEKEIYA